MISIETKEPPTSWLIVCRTIAQEVGGSNPGRTNTRQITVYKVLPL